MLNGTLEGLFDEAKRLLVQAEAEVETKRIAYETAKAEHKAIHDMLRAAGQIEAPAKKKKEPQRPLENISDETRTGVIAAIRAHRAKGLAVIPDVPGSFLIEDLDAPVHSSSVRKAIYLLREEGIVRAVGTVNNGAPHKPTAYALVEVMEDDPPRVG